MKRIGIYVVAIVVQVAVAYVLVMLVVGPKMRGEPFPWQSAEAATEETDEARELGPLLPIQDVLVNITGTKGRRYLKTSMSLEMEGKDIEENANARLPVLRGSVIDILASKEMESLTKPTARSELKAEILERLNGEVSGGEFRNVYFTEFLVQ